MTEVETLLISIVIPARNEAADIDRTLDACVAIDYEPKEIIVVDDSTDETPEIVSRYADRGVRLIHREENRNGCCGARNRGMQEARGDIVVLMNADNVPRPDFLRRLLPHYEQGADCVVVNSVVLNRDNLWAQYLHADDLTRVAPNPRWSEGFSCRREAAEAVGYIPGDFPIPFCRDNSFSPLLEQAGFKKHVDRTISMEHVCADTFRSFWNNRVWRGTMSAPHAYYMRGIPVPIVALREAFKAMRTIGRFLLILPAILRALKQSRNISSGARNIPALLIVGLVNDLATLTGNLKGLLRLVREEGVFTRSGSRYDIPIPCPKKMSKGV